MILIRKSESEEIVPPLHYDIFNQRIVNPDDAGGVKIAVSRLEPGGYAESHVHAGEFQVFYVLEGRISISGEKNEMELSEGMGVIVEPGEEHRVSGVGREKARYLLVTYPPVKQSR